MEDSFSMDWGRDKGWFGDDSSMFNLLCALFLLILHQLLLRSSGIRFQRLGTPLNCIIKICLGCCSLSMSDSLYLWALISRNCVILISLILFSCSHLPISKKTELLSIPWSHLTTVSAHKALRTYKFAKQVQPCKSSSARLNFKNSVYPTFFLHFGSKTHWSTKPDLSSYF